METETCPWCRNPVEEECHCNPLECPICHEVVHGFGEPWEVHECEHVIAWGDNGNCETFWQKDDYRERFVAWAKARAASSSDPDDEEPDDSDEEPDASDLDLLRAFADSAKDIYFDSHNDGAPHGHGFFVYFLFALPPKKATPRRTTTSAGT